MSAQRDTLASLGDVFADRAGVVAFHDAMVDPSDAYELGVALATGASGTSMLVSYNPRHRAAAPRLRTLRALEHAGFDTRVVRAVFERVPTERASTVIGLEWSLGARGATLYLEEVSRFHDPVAIAGVERDLAKLVGVPAPAPSGEPGSPYIWALDLARGAARPTALKIYRQTEDTSAVLASARSFVGGGLDARCESAWTGGAVGSGWILQRRFDREGRPRLKVYKTYPYERAQDDAADAEARALVRAVPHDGAAERALERVQGRATSCGVSFAPGCAEPQSVTAYWRLERDQLQV